MLYARTRDNFLCRLRMEFCRLAEIRGSDSCMYFLVINKLQERSEICYKFNKVGQL